MNLREAVSQEKGPVDGYLSVVREERFFCGILFHLLLSDDSFFRDFLQKCKVGKAYERCDCAVYVEYAMARDLWNRFGVERDSNASKLEFIRSRVALPKDLAAIDPLDTKQIGEFNKRFVSGPPSNDYIQSPARWGITKICEQFAGPKEIKDACYLKWAFNVKPDLVIELDNDSAVCVEAKFESREACYPTSKKEIDAYQEAMGGPELTPQCDVQEYLMDKILGFEKTFQVFLSCILPRKRKQEDEENKMAYLTWTDAFEGVSSDCKTVKGALDKIRKGQCG